MLFLIFRNFPILEPDGDQKHSRKKQALKYVYAILLFRNNYRNLVMTPYQSVFVLESVCPYIRVALCPSRSYVRLHDHRQISIKLEPCVKLPTCDTYFSPNRLILSARYNFYFSQILFFPFFFRNLTIPLPICTSACSSFSLERWATKTYIYPVKMRMYTPSFTLYTLKSKRQQK